MLGLAGWSLSDLLSNEYSKFQQAVCVAVALYIHMTKNAWASGPPPIAKTPDNKPLPLTYSQARSQIKTGDMVGITTGTLGGHIIRAGQALVGLDYAHITHCGIAVWQSNRLMLVEMNVAGNAYKPLSQYADKRMVVCEPPAGTNLLRFDLGLGQMNERHIPYSLLDIVRIVLRLIPLRWVDTRKWGGDGQKDKVCSLLPAWVYQQLGGDVSAIPKLAAPAEVVIALPVRFEIGA